MVNYTKFRETHPHKFTVKIPCECGGSYVEFQKSRHFKQKKHLYYVETGEKFNPIPNAVLVKQCRERKKKLLLVK